MGIIPNVDGNDDGGGSAGKSALPPTPPTDAPLRWSLPGDEAEMVGLRPLKAPGVANNGNDGEG